jgi:hypothetical protein
MSTRRRFRNQLAQLSRLSLAAATLLACDREPDHLSYDSDGVAKNVLALIPHNTAWARSSFPDAMLYRVELRADAGSDEAPSVALYSYFSPASRQFLTATSEPKVPWSGAEPQAWPADRPAPPPLPDVPTDFRAAWEKARGFGIKNATTAVLEVNAANALPIVTWTVLGEMKDLMQRGVYLDALTGERISPAQLREPPTAQVQVEIALTSIRKAFATSTSTQASESKAANLGRCQGNAVPVSTETTARCYDFALKGFTAGVR